MVTAGIALEVLAVAAVVMAIVAFPKSDGETGERVDRGANPQGGNTEDGTGREPVRNG